MGTIVKVPVKSKVKNAIVLKSADKPDFETLAILEITPFYYTQVQFEIAKFIATYYFASFSEALSLFTPFRKEEVSEDRDKVSIVSAILPILTDAQKQALQEIQRIQTSLLFGVTGSGKTEIFIHLIAQTLLEGKSVILLMPEISLTPQMQQRLEAYFGKSIAIWHSKLTKVQKRDILENIYTQKVKIVAGARSALFAPLEDVGLIIVDEEHDDAYKAMSTPRYNAKDLSVYMGKKIGAKVLLASATPSLGSYSNYEVVRLKTPFIQSNKEFLFVGGEGINETMLQRIKAVKANHEQSILFLPTRGNFKYLYCPACGKTHKCPFCSVGMALHRDNRHLRCHYCGFSEPIATLCSSCGYTSLATNRMGTKEAVAILEENVEDILVGTLDKDNITTAKKLSIMLQKLSSKELDILVGTQMISKGHNYPDITLSIILGLDYILSLADFRAKERAVSLLFQIAGRSGRNKDGYVIIQTNHKEQFEPYLSDYELFIKDELGFREIANYPPYSRMARILIEKKDEMAAKGSCDEVVALLQGKIEIVGFGKAPIEKIANRYRYHIIVRSHSQKEMLQVLHSIKRADIKIDMDAVDFS